MENSPIPLARKLLEKARQRQKEIDELASPIRCPVNKGRTSSLDKENMEPLTQSSQVEDISRSASVPKSNHFAAIAESYKNFEYEICHVSKSKEDYLIGAPRKICGSSQDPPLESGDTKQPAIENVPNKIESQNHLSEKLETLNKQVSDEISVNSESQESEKDNNDETLSMERKFTRLSVADSINLIDEVERNHKNSSKSTSTTHSSKVVTNTKAMDIVKKFDCSSRNFRSPRKQAAVKYIDGKVAVKSLRPGALSPTLLYGNRQKIDMRNSEIVIPESTSVKNLKSKWEANIISGAKMETNDIRISHDHPLDDKKLPNENEDINENTPTEILGIEEWESSGNCKSDEEDCNDILDVPEENIKCEIVEEHEDKVEKEVFNFDHIEESNIPSSIPDCKTPKNLMDDISCELLNKLDTPRSRLSEKLKMATDLPVDSPQRQIVHRISFYRKKAKEIEEVVRHNIDSASSDVVSSSGCSGCGISNGSHQNEDTCEEYIDIEATIKTLQEGIRVQQDQIAQASRAILYCRENDCFKGSREEIDAQRALLIANEKKKVLLMEYEKIKKGGVPSSFSREPRVKIGEKVFHTQLVSTDTEIKNCYIEFPVHINLKNLPANFVGQLEVFSVRTKKDPKHGKDSRGKNKTLTPFKRFSQSMSSTSNHQSIPSPNVIVNSSFHKVGILNFDISHVNKKSFVLRDVKQPLEGTINISMNCIPEKESTVEYKGFLNLYQFVGDLSSWNRYWCVLKGSNMVFWKYPEEEDKKQPAIIIDLESVKGEVKHINDESACFPNTMQLHVEVLDKGELSTISILFAADTTPQMESWLTHINEIIKYISLWNCKKKSSIKKCG